MSTLVLSFGGRWAVRWPLGSCSPAHSPSLAACASCLIAFSVPVILFLLFLNLSLCSKPHQCQRVSTQQTTNACLI